MNCVGLFIGILRELGGYDKLVAEAEEHAGYRLPTSPGIFMKLLLASSYLNSVKPLELVPGNFVLFFMSGTMQHIGMLTEPGIVIHASQQQKKVVEHRLPEGWKIAKEFELAGLEA